ncbi:MAG: TolC family protein [Candidatus Krumholzibacteriota bacterium]|nr:TolC family protein [Candidatus Krumholzibacteriota bacterium]
MRNRGVIFRRVMLILPVFLTLMAGVSLAGEAVSDGKGDDTAGELELSLDEAIRLGLEHDEAIRQAGLQVDGAYAGLKEARSGRLPDLAISGQYGRNIRKPVMFLPSDMGDAFGGVTKIELGEDNDFTAAAQLSYNLWTAGRVSAGIGASKEIVEAMKLQKIAVSDYLRFQVVNAYYTVLLSMENLEIAEKAYKETEEAVRINRAGYKEGTVSRFDLLRAEVELENRSPQIVEAANAVEQALVVLRRLSGLDPARALSLTDSLEMVGEAEDLDYYIDLMKKENVYIRALDHQVQALRHNLGFEKAERYPVLQLGVNFVVQAQWSDSYMPESKNLARSSAVTLGFQIPVFDGLKAKARINRARSDLRSAEIEFEKTINEKEMAVRIAYLALENAVSSLKGREETVALAEEAHRLALVRMKNGLATPVERLDAELAMTTARGQMAQALFACNIAKAALGLATGAGSLIDNNNLSVESE